ncbi:unnamed protein product [Dibothriocephalus latus]|uniref:Uncharacterized protein n=1 Tax=Dibothriocephalus latus TaxID=60516 RepID=A0A3P7LBJ7_DIBLA|nr:unnamed protein product [Dibothriocephalus latus]
MHDSESGLFDSVQVDGGEESAKFDCLACPPPFLPRQPTFLANSKAPPIQFPRPPSSSIQIAIKSPRQPNSAPPPPLYRKRRPPHLNRWFAGMVEEANSGDIEKKKRTKKKKKKKKKIRSLGQHFYSFAVSTSVADSSSDT